MIIISARTWLAEQEQKKHPAIFLLEWLSIFAVALLFWTTVFLEIRISVGSVGMATAVACLYASALVYLRLYKVTGCRKCHSALAFSQEEIARRHVRDVEKCVEIEHGGKEWCEHSIDLYARRYRVEIIKFRCRRCHATWEEERDSPLSDYELVRTINLKD